MQIWSGAVLRLSFDSGFRVWRFRAFWALEFWGLGFLGPCERERVRERERGSGVFRFWFRGLGFRVLGFLGFGPGFPCAKDVSPHAPHRLSMVRFTQGQTVRKAGLGGLERCCQSRLSFVA